LKPLQTENQKIELKKLNALFLNGAVSKEYYETQRKRIQAPCKIINGLCLVHGYSVSEKVHCPIGGSAVGYQLDKIQEHILTIINTPKWKDMFAKDAPDLLAKDVYSSILAPQGW
jgi:hypothetical protein